MTLKFTYTIDLPANTSKEVLDWFVSMDKANQLSVELIELVYKNLQSCCIAKSIFKNENYDEQIKNMNDKQSEIQDTFINNLYNWQESTSALFKEKKMDQKDKKRMMSV